jgi:hypothetical protein
MPFSLVIDEETSWGDEVRVSQTSVCGSWGPVAGDLRYFADRFGRARGSIEGTQIPHSMIWEYARKEVGEIVYDPANRRAPLRLRHSRTYHGFKLDEEEVAIDVFPPEDAQRARRVLAEAMASAAALHRDVKRNRDVFRELREVYRRSGGTTAEVGEAALTDYFERKLAPVTSYTAFADANLAIDPDEFVPRAERKRWTALPDTISLRGTEYPLDYAIEDGSPLVRARIPEKLLWQLEESDLPKFDRPLHWTVLRGKRGAVRAATLEEAKELATLSKAELRARSGERDKQRREPPPKRRGDRDHGPTRSRRRA